MTFSWDDVAEPGDWISFKPFQNGDGFAGTVTKLGSKNYDGKDKAVVTLRLAETLGNIGADLTVGEEYAFTPGANLTRKLADKAVAVGDEIRVEMTGLEDTGQPSMMKVFDLKVRKGDGAPEQPEPQPAATAATDDGWS